MNTELYESFPEHDFVKMLLNSEAWQLTFLFQNGNVMYQDIKDSILVDVLAVTMFEKAHNKKVSFTSTNITSLFAAAISSILFTNIRNKALEVLAGNMSDLRDDGLIFSIAGEVRIPEEKLKYVMGLTGVYYSI